MALSWSKAVWCLRRLSKVTNLERCLSLDLKIAYNKSGNPSLPKREEVEPDRLKKARELAIVTRYNNKVTVNAC